MNLQESHPGGDLRDRDVWRGGGVPLGWRDVTWDPLEKALDGGPFHSIETKNSRLWSESPSLSGGGKTEGHPCKGDTQSMHTELHPEHTAGLAGSLKCRNESHCSGL